MLESGLCPGLSKSERERQLTLINNDIFDLLLELLELAELY